MNIPTGRGPKLAKIITRLGKRRQTLLRRQTPKQFTLAERRWWARLKKWLAKSEKARK